MNNEKDTEKTSTNSYGHMNVSNVNALQNKPIYEFANKKTEKLVTALYMVTDCMDNDDAIKGRLRLLGVELLSDMYKLSMLSPMDKSIHINTSLGRIKEILSLVDIACTIGFVSDMNSSILDREFKSLIIEMQSYQSKDKHFTFTLKENMFEVERPREESFLPEDHIKDINQNKGHIIKRTYSLSSQNNIRSPLSLIKGLTQNHLNNISKQDRSQKILSLIKEKKDSSNNPIGLSIKDISIAFTDCSEKTIQRELNSLVFKGLIKKIGAKRWSRYMAIVNS